MKLKYGSKHQGVSGEVSALTPSEVSAVLKIRIRSVYGLLKSRRLTGFKIGRVWRVLEADLEAFVQESRKDAIL